MNFFYQLQTEINGNTCTSCGDEDTVLGNTAVSDVCAVELSLEALLANGCLAAEKSLVSENRRSSADSADVFIISCAVVDSCLNVL